MTAKNIEICPETPDACPVNGFQTGQDCSTGSIRSKLENTRKLLLELPPSIAGEGGHKAAFRAACTLVRQRHSKDEAWDLLCEWNEARAKPPWSEFELRHKLASAKEAVNNTTKNQTEHRFTKTAKFGELGDKSRDIILSGVNLESLRQLSPKQDLDDCDAEFYVDQLFSKTDLLCVGCEVHDFNTLAREEWRGRLNTQAYIVPNAMSARTGLTQSGKPSSRCKTNVGPRCYLPIEFDFNAGDLPCRKNGTPVTPQDACAALLTHLGAMAPLVMVVNSAGKSLHGWFNARGISENTIKRFMDYAQTLGADRSTLSKIQMVRLPMGVRQPGNKRQKVVYFNPALIA